MITEDTDLGTITYQRELEEIYKNVGILILYQANQYNANYGDTSAEELAMTDNDKQFFYKMLKDAFDDVFKTVSVYAKEVTTPYQYSIDVDSDGNNEVAITLKMPDNWNNIMKSVLDNRLSDALEMGVIYRWFRYIVQPELAKWSEKDYYEMLGDIKSAIMYRTKPPKKKYNWF